eukprot:6188181-Pleurochrysis_carterae.AAC.3
MEGFPDAAVALDVLPLASSRQVLAALNFMTIVFDPFGATTARGSAAGARRFVCRTPPQAAHAFAGSVCDWLSQGGPRTRQAFVISRCTSFVGVSFGASPLSSWHIRLSTDHGPDPNPNPIPKPNSNPTLIQTLTLRANLLCSRARARLPVSVTGRLGDLRLLVTPEPGTAGLVAVYTVRHARASCMRACALRERVNGRDP